MPVFAAIGTAISAAGTAIAGAFAGMTAFQTISAVGSIFNIVGTLTGNEKLAKVGAVASLAGGIGSFAQGKGWIASDGAMNDGGSAIAEMKNAPSPTVDAPGATALTDSATSLESGMVTDAIAQSAPQQSSLMTAGAPQTNVMGSPPASNALPQGDWGPDAPPGMAPPAPKGLVNMFKDFAAWTNENKTLTSIGASFIGGMFDGEKKARTEKYGAEAEFYRNRTRNASAVPNMNFRPSGPVGFPSTAPRYTAPQVSLFNARG